MIMHSVSHSDHHQLWLARFSAHARGALARNMRAGSRDASAVLQVRLELVSACASSLFACGTNYGKASIACTFPHGLKLFVRPSLACEPLATVSASNCHGGFRIVRRPGLAPTVCPTEWLWSSSPTASTWAVQTCSC